MGLLGFVIVLKNKKKYMLDCIDMYCISIKTQKKKRGAGEKAVSKILAVLAEDRVFDPQHSCKRNGVHLESRCWEVAAKGSLGLHSLLF